MISGSAPHSFFSKSLPSRIVLATIALAALAFSPQLALAQRGGHGGGGGGGGHFGGGGGGHVGGGGGGFGGPHVSMPAQSRPSTPPHVSMPPPRPATTNPRPVISATPPRTQLPAPGSSSAPANAPASVADAHRGLIVTPAPAPANSVNEAPRTTIGFPPANARPWQPTTSPAPITSAPTSNSPAQGTVRSFSGQGRQIWQEPSPSPSTSRSISTSTPSTTSANTSRSLLAPSPERRSPMPPRGIFPRRFFQPIIVYPSFGFFGPGFGLFGFNSFGCDPWSAWGCSGLGGGYGGFSCDPWSGFGCFGLGYNNGYYPGPTNDYAAPPSENLQNYGPYDWQNPPEGGTNAPLEAPNAPSAVPEPVLYLRNGSAVSVADYWLSDSKLHYVTDDGVEKTIDLDQLDFQRTVDYNASRGMNFTLDPSSHSTNSTSPNSPAANSPAPATNAAPNSEPAPAPPNTQSGPR